MADGVTGVGLGTGEVPTDPEGEVTPGVDTRGDGVILAVTVGVYTGVDATPDGVYTWVVCAVGCVVGVVGIVFSVTGTYDVVNTLVDTGDVPPVINDVV